MENCRLEIKGLRPIYKRTIFLSQRIRVWRAMTCKPIIRIFGYEVPLENYRRGRCIDLMGYDGEPDLHLLEQGPLRTDVVD